MNEKPTADDGPKLDLDELQKNLFEIQNKIARQLYENRDAEKLDEEAREKILRLYRDWFREFATAYEKATKDHPKISPDELLGSQIMDDFKTMAMECLAIHFKAPNIFQL